VVGKAKGFETKLKQMKQGKVTEMNKKLKEK